MSLFNPVATARANNFDPCASVAMVHTAHVRMNAHAPPHAHGGMSSATMHPVLRIIPAHPEDGSVDLSYRVMPTHVEFGVASVSRWRVPPDQPVHLKF